MKKLKSINSLIGKIWHYSENPDHFEELKSCGFKMEGKRCIANVMSGSVVKAEKLGFEVDWK